jgi:bifunctional DNase/RNase
LKSPHEIDITPVTFSSDMFEENKIKDEDLIKLSPYGVSLNTDPNRPTMLFKDESGKYVLPVCINSLEAGVTLSQSTQTLVPITPHKFTGWLMNTLNIQIAKVIFVEIKGSFQYVRVFLEGHPNYGSVKMRAEEVISMCLHMNADFFATKTFIERSKKLSVELGNLKEGIRVNPHLFVKNTPYMQ